MSEGIDLVVIEAAELIHQNAVNLAARHGRYEAALIEFNKADGVLLQAAVENAATTGSLTIDEPSTLLQQQRIDRDRQFTFARIGIRDDNPGVVTQAYLRLADNTDNDDRVARYFGPEYYGPVSWSYYQSEVGASLGLLGRLGTVSGVMQNESEAIPSSQAQEHYEEAAERLSIKGANQYYAVSNAMNAARHERIFGTKAKVGEWLRVANGHLLKAAMQGRPNLLAATRTTLSRTRDLRSVDSSRSSVLQRP